MLLGGPHPLQNKVPLKDACTNNKGPKQFSRVSNTCSMKMTNHQSWFSSMEQFRNLLFKQLCVVYYSNTLCVVFIISLKFNLVFINTVVVWFNLFRAMLASSHRESLFPTN